MDDDAVARAALGHLAADLDHVTGGIGTEHVGAVETSATCAPYARPREQVQPVQRRGADADLDLVRSNGRLREIAVLEHLRAAVLRDIDSLHLSLPRVTILSWVELATRELLPYFSQG